MPTELVVAALASCFCVAIAWAARKKRIEVGDLEVQVQPHRQVGEPRHGSYDLWVALLDPGRASSRPRWSWPSATAGSRTRSPTPPEIRYHLDEPIG